MSIKETASQIPESRTVPSPSRSFPSLITRAGTLGVLLAGAIASTSAHAAIHRGDVEDYRYVLVVPDTHTSDDGRPLVVVLHGCRQSAAEIRELTRFDALGERFGFAVLYPETHASAGNPLGCWRWWAPENQVRGGGEPGIILASVEEASAKTAIDRQRVYALGLSSGGAMSPPTAPET